MKIARSFLFICIIAGWVFSGYFLLRVQSLGEEMKSGFDLCEFLFDASCDAALLDPAAWQLGVSLPSLGLMYFSLLGVLLIIDSSISRQVATGLAAVVLGAGFRQVLYLSASDTPCGLCYMVHVLNLLLFATLWIIYGNKLKSRGTYLLVSLRSALPAIVVSVGLIISGYVLESYIIDKNLGTAPVTRLKRAYAEFQREEPVTFPAYISDGNPQTRPPIQLAVFSSYQCPACKEFNESMFKIREKFGEDLELKVFHFPLSTKCNPLLEFDQQPRSCEAALAAIAAERQGAFELYNNALFSTNLECDDATLSGIVKAINLDYDRFVNELTDSTSILRLKQDIALGNSLAISATPTVFLNGKRLKNRSTGALMYFLSREIEQ